ANLDGDGGVAVGVVVGDVMDVQVHRAQVQGKAVGTQERGEEIGQGSRQGEDGPAVEVVGLRGGDVDHVQADRADREAGDAEGVADGRVQPDQRAVGDDDALAAPAVAEH